MYSPTQEFNKTPSLESSHEEEIKNPKILLVKMGTLPCFSFVMKRLAQPAAAREAGPTNRTSRSIPNPRAIASKGIDAQPLVPSRRLFFSGSEPPGSQDSHREISEVKTKARKVGLPLSTVCACASWVRGCDFV